MILKKMWWCRVWPVALPARGAPWYSTQANLPELVLFRVLPRDSPGRPSMTDDSTISQKKTAIGLPIFLLMALLATTLPLFVSLAPWSDVTYFDICARNVMRGGVAYRDLLGNNFPGMVWIHIAVRSMLGWGSVTIRLVDLAVLALMIWQLIRWIAADGSSGARQAWLALALTAFYLSTSEFCHGQRDVWMMVPALAALHLRRRMTHPAPADARPHRMLLLSGLEGVFWASACWIKPQALIVAVACWLASAALAARRRPGVLGSLAVQAAGTLSGAVLALVSGVALLAVSGSWPYFVDAFTRVSPDYFHATDALPVHAVRRLRRFIAFLPWSLLGVAAVPIALAVLSRFLVAGGSRAAGPQPGDPPSGPGASAGLVAGLVPVGDPCGLVLLSAFFLSWYAQAGGLQHVHEYVVVPLILTAGTLILGHPWNSTRPFLSDAMLAAFVAQALWSHPLLQPARLALWARCLEQGSTPALRNALDVNRVALQQPDWESLHLVGRWLLDQRLAPDDLTCHVSTTIPLYLQVGLDPATRFVYFNATMLAASGSKEAMRSELARSRTRFVVTDGLFGGAAGPDLSRFGPSAPSDPRPRFDPTLTAGIPWDYPIVYRAGRYLVHRVPGRPAAAGRQETHP